MIKTTTMRLTSLALATGIAAALAGCSKPAENTDDASAAAVTAEETGQVVLQPDDVEYVPLNPARGDAAPQAGVLWGDIRDNVASGTLLRFADGFSSPPHIHNITYRAIVISGDVHNAAPDAPKNWMGPGSFWVQAAGEDHITAAKPGSSSLAFLEILSGPYLVEPSEKAFSTDDESVNIKASEIDWQPATNLDWLSLTDEDSSVEVAELWSNSDEGGESGRFLRLSQGGSVTLNVADRTLKAVVIDGTIEHQVPEVSEGTTLGQGGFFSTNAGVANAVSCQAETCVVYLRT